MDRHQVPDHIPADILDELQGQARETVASRARKSRWRRWLEAGRVAGFVVAALWVVAIAAIAAWVGTDGPPATMFMVAAIITVVAISATVVLVWRALRRSRTATST